MKTKLWLNKVPLLQLFYPSIIDWATKLDYSIPSISVLAKYTVKFLECKSYESVYNGETITAIGTHYAHLNSIKLAGERDHFELITTLIHEFAHAVQYFSHGDKFNLLYSTESKRAKHSGNKYEDEARALENRLLDRIRRDSIFCDDIEHFVFEFEKQKDPPKLKPCPVEKFYYPVWRDLDWYDNYNYKRRKQWWNN